ncbi:MAG: hypothetical protein HYZ14_18325 [Bacteroidetes bacterium]|nr:hypothetical protein [Bacteroidota bacterium]
MKPVLLLIAFITCMVSTPVLAQADTAKAEQLYAITKTDGTEYIGTILSDDGREVLINTAALGKIYIIKSDIKSIVKIDGETDFVRGEYSPGGPFSTRYAFTTNALPIKRGENYALINLYGPEVHFAVSDHLNVGIMSTWIASPLVLALKYSAKTKTKNVNLSLGTLLGSSGYLNNFRGFGGLHFANITFGSREQNITFSAGYAYYKSGGEMYGPDQEGTFYNGNQYYAVGDYHLKPATHGPVFSIAGITKVGSKASFVFDSMVGVFSKRIFNTATTELTAPYYNAVTGAYTEGQYKHVVTEDKAVSTALFIMPGMRFQTTENRAFQVSLAGVSIFRGRGYEGYKKSYSFPLPMLSWFVRF